MPRRTLRYDRPCALRSQIRQPRHPSRESTYRTRLSKEQRSRLLCYREPSQDAIDTGRVLQLRQALALVSTELDLFAVVLAELVHKNRETLIAART